MVTRLAAGIYWLDLQGTNAYVVDDGGTLTLVDTGMPWTAGTVARALDRIGSVAAVERVLLTHVDFDHVGGLNRIDGLDATVYVGREDEPYLRGEQKPPWDNRKGALQRATDWWRSGPALPVEALADGDTVGSFTAYHTPGHTPGHTAFVSESLRLGAVGDLVSERDGAYRLPPWYLAYDEERASESLREFAERAPAFEIACQGHGTPFVSGGSDRVAEAARRAATQQPEPRNE
jgi:glyoxylase-like metal-dependent hydrolase (beta-lactamase superfamily II)